MKTAVEWLYEQMPKKIQPHYKKQLEQAKEMEKEQIVEGFNFGVYDGGGLIKKYKMSGEQYYNQTFKQ
jgi:hypothetical protein